MPHSLLVRSSPGYEVCPQILEFQLFMGTMGKKTNNGNWPPMCTFEVQHGLNRLCLPEGFPCIALCLMRKKYTPNIFQMNFWKTTLAYIEDRLLITYAAHTHRFTDRILIRSQSCPVEP